MGASGPEKVHLAVTPDKESPQAAHNQSGPEHVTKTHPGETQPHPETGVHAVHVHHLGGGKHMTHTHHDGGEVTTKNHNTAEEAMEEAHQGLPSGDHMGDDNNAEMGGTNFAEQLGAIGGDEGSEYE